MVVESESIRWFRGVQPDGLVGYLAAGSLLFHVETAS